MVMLDGYPDVNSSVDMKLYVSNVFEDIVQQNYLSFMEEINIEYLTLFTKGKESSQVLHLFENIITKKLLS